MKNPAVVHAALHAAEVEAAQAVHVLAEDKKNPDAQEVATLVAEQDEDPDGQALQTAPAFK